MKKIVLFVLPSLLASTIMVSAQSQEVQSFCNLAIPARVRVFDWTNWSAATITDQNLFFEPFHWDASSTIYYQHGSDQGFNQPDDIYQRWRVSLIQSSGAVQWIFILQSRSTPDTDYVYVFETTEPSTDEHGQHFGDHPCRAFAANAGMVNDWIHRAYHPN